VSLSVTDSPSSALSTSLRSHPCGSLRLAHVGAQVQLGGWVHRSRDLGGLVFLDLRDRSGIVQLAFGPEWSDAATLAGAAAVGVESVVLVEGTVVARAETQRNPDMSTGDIDVQVTALRVVGPATTPAFPVAPAKGDKLPAEELRLRHRYLDLRRGELQRNLILRHRLTQAARRFLDARGFLELETPILTKPTPEGARDYLVPSRVHPGEFYALPQSPQIYKQLFMCAGFDRYFQIARCFRDEDLRADRQPEFTQIDIEASFITRDDLLAIAEALVADLWTVGGVSVDAPFPRLAYADAMERYGCDRPDLRYDLVLHDVTPVFAASELTFIKAAVERGERVRGLRVPGGAALSRKQTDELEQLAKGAGASGLIVLKRTAEGLDGKIAKFLPPGAADALGLAEGELGMYVAGPDRIASPALDRVRQAVAQRLDLVPADRHEFVVVTDFPMFDRDPATGALAAVHHPFTAPHPDDLARLDDAPETARALAYDIVYNGLELGGGSIRISDPALQARIFGLLGIDEATAQARFGFLLEALRSGAPPHGGIAFGLDRIAMLLAGAGSLRDVIAFPKTTAARALFEGAPSPVPDADLRELSLRVAVHGGQG
jgi:aspartyl-tRNA synthetase